MHERFASALTVFLRAEGIPSRLAVGYAARDHDNFTGTFTVRAHDARAWVEAAAYAGVKVQSAGTSLGVLVQALRHRLWGRRAMQ